MHITTEAKFINIAGKILVQGGSGGPVLQPGLTQKGGKGGEGYIVALAEVSPSLLPLLCRSLVSALPKFKITNAIQGTTCVTCRTVLV